MKVVYGSSQAVGAGLYGLPSPLIKDPRLPWSSLFNGLFDRCYMSTTLPIRRYCPLVPLADDDSEVFGLDGSLTHQKYSVQEDIAKFSHPLAQFLSVIGKGMPRLPARANGVQHVEINGTFGGDSHRFYTPSERNFYDFRIDGIGTGPSKAQAVYSTFNGSGVRYPAPGVHTSNKLIGGGSLFGNLAKVVSQMREDAPQHLIKLDFLPDVWISSYWGASYELSVEKLQYSGDGDSVTISWTEWFVNLLTRVARRADCVYTIRLTVSNSTFDATTHQWTPLRLNWSYSSDVEWFNVDKSGSTFEEVFTTTSQGSYADFGEFSPLNFPLRGVGFCAPQDLSKLFEHGRIALERARVGSASSTSRLLDVLRGLTLNWIEFCAELDELFELLPALTTLLSAFAVKNGKLPSLRAVIKGIASGHLFLQFGLVPLHTSWTDAQALAKRLDVSLDSMSAGVRGRARSGRVTTQPKAELFEGLIVVPTVLEFHSSCDFSLPTDVYSDTVISLDSAGLLPTPTRLWDLAPFSWAIDILVGFQSRMAAVEAIILLSVWMADAFLHTVEFTIEGDDLNSMFKPFGLSPSDGSPAEFRAYMREMSAFIPFTALRETYPLADPHVVGSVATLVSLLISILL